MSEELHQQIAALAPFVGTWSGEGRGEYPSIEPFGFDETIVVGHVGKPFLTYTQRTRHLDDGRPLHGETGYWRMPAPGRVELVVAHPTGLVEVDEGSFDGSTLRLRSTFVGRTASAKEVTAIERDFVLDGEVLSYELRMAAVGEQMTHHLAAKLRRA